MIKAYLREHPKVAFVFIDFCSLAQGRRKHFEQLEFNVTLPNIKCATCPSSCAAREPTRDHPRPFAALLPCCLMA